MSPYNFLPGLGSTTTIHLPPTEFLLPDTDNKQSVLLTFTAVPVSNVYVDSSSRVEVWTEAGTPGEWRAVTFSAPAPTLAGHATSTSSALVAYISLPVKETSFGYTYRIQHDSGEITWLGDMGCNGRVEIVPSTTTTAEAGKAEEEGDGLWRADEWLDFSLNKWTGFGVHIDDSDIPHGVFLTKSTQDLAFAYIHPSLDLGNPSNSSESAPSPSPPFATFHPRQTTSLTPSSSGIALLTPSSEIYLSTSTACLKPCVRARGEGTPGAVAGGQPAAYASYCGLGFAGGERDRTRAFRSLFARQQRSSSSGAVNSWAYLPRIRKVGLDEAEKDEEEEQSHAVAVVYPANGSMEPRWMVAYVFAGSGDRVRWDCSAVVEEEAGRNKVALWNAGERCAVLPVEDEEQGGGHVVVSFATDNAPLLKTLQIVRLVEMQQPAGPSVFFGILSSVDEGRFQQGEGWTYEPEKVEMEEYYVDEQVIAPAATPTSTLTPTPIPDDSRRASEPTSDAPPSADSGVTESTTSPSSSEQGDETSVTSIEEVLDDEDVPHTSSGLKGQGEEERDGYVFVAPVTREEGEAPMTGDLHAAERGSHAAEGASSGSKPVRNDDDNDTVDPTNEQERPAQPTAVVAPRKSFFRFLWITLGLFQSLYFRAISWFRSCWGGPKGADVGGAAGADGLVSSDAEGDENDQTPLLNKDSAADYASTSGTGGYTKTVPPKAAQEVQEPAPPAQEAQEAQEPAPQAMETIRVLEKRKIVIPAYIHTRTVNAGDLFLLTSFRDLGRLVAEIEGKHDDNDDKGSKTSFPSWTSVDVVQETVAPDSEMRLVKLSGMESDAHLRIRLV